MTGKRDETATGVVEGIRKQFGKGAVFMMEDVIGEPVQVISTGHPGIDEATGIGGYPRGRVVEIYGPESSGKTTLALHAIKSAQEAGGIAAFIDAEHCLDVGYAKAIGVNMERLLISQPDNGEQALDIAEALVRSGTVDLVVIDSVAALVPKAEVEGEMGMPSGDLQARLMSQALRKLTAITHRMNATIIFTNQMRYKNGVIFGSTETTTGGNALKFYASMRLDVRRIGSITEDGGRRWGDREIADRLEAERPLIATQCGPYPDTVKRVTSAVDDAVKRLREHAPNNSENPSREMKSVGARIRVKVVKNKCAAPFRDSEAKIVWGKGLQP